jgi:hypothetical protein
LLIVRCQQKNTAGNSESLDGPVTDLGPSL